MKLFPLKSTKILLSLKFLEVAKNSPYYMIFLLTLTSGIRKGEILTLAWRYVNLEEGYLSIAQALDKHGNIVPRPKTRAGFGSIDLPDEVIDALIKHKSKTEEQKRKAGDL